jgi:predicted nucleic acid-binding protein
LPEVICNTSPLQYLHQIVQQKLLPKLVSRIVVPTAVAQELAEGRRRGLDLPIPEALAWIDLRAPRARRLSAWSRISVPERLAFCFWRWSVPIRS